MAKGKKTGGKNFEKGHAPYLDSPGRPPVTPVIKQLKAFNQEALIKILTTLSTATVTELAAMSKDPTKTILEMTIISIWKKAYELGDQQRINFILDRLIGKTKEQIEHTGDGFRVVIEDYLGKKK